jgi:Fe-S cluster biogenesis protein NfuA/nitrite reductase/ring-hydroxylating ferredoxin subunit
VLGKSQEVTAGEDLAGRVQILSEQIDGLSDVHARELAQEMVSAVMELYGDGLVRIMAALEQAGPAGAAIRDELVEDGAVASLLLIHDLYPISLEDRVIEALDSVRPYMESHGGNVELLSLEDGVARLRLQGSCSGCSASQATLEMAIKQALDEHAPDLEGLEVEGVIEEAPIAEGPAPTGFELPLATVDAAPSWVPLEGVARISPGELVAFDADGTPLLVANVAGSLLAYRDACASCGATLHNGELLGRMLRCGECGVEFDLPRAGRAAGNEPLQLDPVPLLDGKVAV